MNCLSGDTLGELRTPLACGSPYFLLISLFRVDGKLATLNAKGSVPYNMISEQAYSRKTHLPSVMEFCYANEVVDSAQVKSGNHLYRNIHSCYVVDKGLNWVCCKNRDLPKILRHR